MEDGSGDTSSGNLSAREGTAIRFDVLKNIIEDFESEPRLRERLGDDILVHLGLLAQGNDFRLAYLAADEEDMKQASDISPLLNICFNEIFEKHIFKHKGGEGDAQDR